MTYYDSIAAAWHANTGRQGDAFKKLVLNAVLLEQIAGIDQRSILELGAGNGYFMPLVLRHFPGQSPVAITITDRSARLLEIARREFRIPGAGYLELDASAPFPLHSGRFDLVIASMLFNELPARAFRQALGECRRVLVPGGSCLITVTHPDFIDGLHRRGLLKPARAGLLTMPGSGNLRLPVVVRSLKSYRACLKEAGFQYEETEVSPTTQAIESKAGLRHAWKVPVALVFACKI